MDICFIPYLFIAKGQSKPHNWSSVKKIANVVATPLQKSQKNLLFMPAMIEERINFFTYVGVTGLKYHNLKAKSVN
jgi:hypothetical protein